MGLFRPAAPARRHRLRERPARGATETGSVLRRALLFS
jgi:hypothetical protein